MRVLLGSFGLSSFGNGAVLPLTAVYVSEHLGLGLPWAGRYFAAIAFTSLLLTPLGGRLADLGWPGAAAAAGLLLPAGGYLLLSTARDGRTVLLCAVLVGAGNALFYPAFTPAVGSMVRQEERRRVFSLRYTAMNVGAGLGAAVGAGFVAGRHGTHGYQSLYALDALTFVPLAVVLLRTGRRPAAAGRDRGSRARGPGEGGYLAVLRSRPLLGLAVVQCGAMLFGYTQFESTVPLLVHRIARGGVYPLSGIVVVNTLAVVVLQRVLVPRLDRWPESTALLLAPACWAAAYCCGALAVVSSGPWGLVALAVFAALFAAGEAAYACSFYPLLMRTAPSGLLGRASAVTSLASNLGSTAGPAIGVTLVAHTAPEWTWLLLALAAAATSAACLTVGSPAAVVADIP